MSETIAVVSSCWGSYEKYREQWYEGISNLSVQPSEVVVIEGGASERWPQATAMNKAVRATSTDWVWPLGIDNFAFPWALDKVKGHKADMLQFGYLRSDGAPYTVPFMSREEYMGKTRNPFVSDSPFRRDAFEAAGGFPMVGFEDWALWRRMVAGGAAIGISPYVHFLYRLHDESRSLLEFTEKDSRQKLYEEMLEAEAA